MQKRLNLVAAWAVSIVSMMVLGQSACADYPDLLKQVPDSANTLLIMKPNTLQSNASSKVEREITRYLDSANMWPIISPWKPEEIVIAAEMDIHHMAPDWEMAAIEFQQAVDVELLAKRSNGVLDSLVGHQVIWLENACILVMNPKQLTVVSPLNRQSATRWLQRADEASQDQLSPYLAEKSRSAVAGSAGMTFIMDLQNVFSPAQVSQAIAGSSLFQKVKPDPTKLFCGIRGLVFDCQVSEDKDSQLVVDFSQSTESLQPIVKRMMVNALVKAGAMLDEFNSWTVKAEGEQISMTGKLSPLGVRRVMSLSAINSAVSGDAGPSGDSASKPANPPAASETQPSGTSSRNEETAARRATKRYFQNVTDSINSVASSRRPNLENAALWINNEARKIDQLNTTNVDPQMLEYGKWVSESMKYVVYLYHQSNNQIQSDMSSTTPVMGTTTFGRAPVYRGNRWGGGYRYSYAPFYSQQLNIGAAAQERRAVVDQNVGAANSKAMEIFRDINQATDQIRGEMSKKYDDRF